MKKGGWKISSSAVKNTIGVSWLIVAILVILLIFYMPGVSGGPLGIRVGVIFSSIMFLILLNAYYSFFIYESKELKQGLQNWQLVAAGVFCGATFVSSVSVIFLVNTAFALMVTVAGSVVIVLFRIWSFWYNMRREYQNMLLMLENEESDDDYSPFGGDVSLPEGDPKEAYDNLVRVGLATPDDSPLARAWRSLTPEDRPRKSEE